MARSDELETQEQAVLRQVLDAYRQGWFPMATPQPGQDLEGDPEVEWVQPSRRAIIPLDGRFHVPKSLAQRVRSGRFLVTSDLAFGAVIRNCAAAKRSDGGAWLVPSIIDVFLSLHKHGHAHSIEAWLASDLAGPAPTSDSLHARREILGRPHVLVGGLYGLALGKVFCGESMFHNPAQGGTDASKVCLVHLVNHLRKRGFELLDAQLANDHTARFGMYELPRAEYLRMLARLSRETVGWEPFHGVAPGAPE